MFVIPCSGFFSDRGSVEGDRANEWRGSPLNGMTVSTEQTARAREKLGRARFVKDYSIHTFPPNPDPKISSQPHPTGNAERAPCAHSSSSSSWPLQGPNESDHPWQDTQKE